MLNVSMSRQRQPWPLKWVALVVLLIIGPYTFLRWHYRKPNPAFQPYHDIKDQANTLRLLSAGFQRISLTAERPADPLRLTNVAVTKTAPGGLPATLGGTLVDVPLLPTQISSVTAAPSTSTMFAYPFEFTCAFADNKQQLSGAYLYVRDGEIFVVPNFERLTGDLLARNRESSVRLTVPAGALKPGQYELTLVGERGSQAWSLVVK